MGGTPLEPLVAITPEEGTPSPKISTTIPYPWEEVIKVTYSSLLADLHQHHTRVQHPIKTNLMKPAGLQQSLPHSPIISIPQGHISPL
jgi:hypothetical protein